MSSAEFAERVIKVNCRQRSSPIKVPSFFNCPFLIQCMLDNLIIELKEY